MARDSFTLNRNLNHDKYIDLDKLAKKAIGEFKSENDFEAFTNTLRKQFWESTLEGEMDDHLRR